MPKWGSTWSREMLESISLGRLTFCGSPDVKDVVFVFSPEPCENPFSLHTVPSGLAIRDVLSCVQWGLSDFLEAFLSAVS